MCRSGSEKRISQSNLAAPPRVCQFEQTARSAGHSEQVGVDDYASAAITKRCPAIGLAKDILCRELARAQFFVAPKHITLRARPLCQQAVGKANSFYRFAVVDGPDLYAGEFGKVLEDWLAVDLILCGVDDDCS
jgi:hypothetical protein